MRWLFPRSKQRPMTSREHPSTWHILLASLSGTTIEFFDFYIYATASVLVFPSIFFPQSSPTSATLQSLATFAIAFFARPIGSAIFGHMGDRLGRKATLVAALMTMGISTIFIGLLPSYTTIGIAAPFALALCRLGQGLGLGGEWGGAVLLATEYAPPGQRALYGMFPQLGAPLGFLCSTSLFVILTHLLNHEEFIRFGWRIPFLASSLLVGLGLYVRLRLSETPVFKAMMAAEKRVAYPMMEVLQRHVRQVMLGILVALPSFALFYLLTVFTLSWGTSHLGYTRARFLDFQITAVLFFAMCIPLSALLAERYGRRRTLLGVSFLIIVYALALPDLLVAANPSRIFAALCIGLGLMGLTYGPVGTVLSELFPARVRYTGASIAFNGAGIFGASLAPYLATWLASHYGLIAVGLYLASACLLSILALAFMNESRNLAMD